MNSLLTLNEINATVSEKSEYLVIDKKDHGKIGNMSKMRS